MSPALRWLGGTVEEVRRARAVDILRGTWVDRHETIYVLTEGLQPGAFDVRTVRPGGFTQFTPGLVRIAEARDGEGKHEEDVVIEWGHKDQYTARVGDRLTWRRRTSTYQWRKLQ